MTPERKAYIRALVRLLESVSDLLLDVIVFGMIVATLIVDGRPEGHWNEVQAAMIFVVWMRSSPRGRRK